MGKRKLLSRLRWWRQRNRSWWWSTLVVVVPIVTLTGAAVLVLARVIDLSTSSARLETIKVALAVGAGTGGALTLVLARRRQWATEHDAAERRLTELYVKAVEQLGSEQAAVRHGGLYALERVAQDNVDHRQTVVNVVCAYLRAPYSPPPDRPGGPRLGVRRSRLNPSRGRVAASSTYQRMSEENRALQEREVRLTAQRILASHLRPHNDRGERLDTYWSGVNLDLSGATLINFELLLCMIDYATFEGARFIGDAWFVDTHFADSAWFERVQFDGSAWFNRAQFADGASFKDTRFNDSATFNDAQFAEEATFEGTHFAGDTRFDRVQFNGYPSFADASFSRGVPDSLQDL